MKGGSELLILITALKGTLIAAAYCLPIIVAAYRRHRRRPAIAAVNLLLGWTVVGWLAALAWALRGSRRPVPAVLRRGRPA